MPEAPIGEYEILQTLTPDQTYLALAPGQRRVILKTLDADCLQRGQLHPNIHSRLARVRELAHSGVANLLGVERADSRVFAVWEYVAGEPLDRHFASISSAAQFALLAKEIMLAVESMHLLGIVHGRIHAGNVIINELKQVKLTHVSPLLYDDPASDQHDLTAMLASLASQRGWNEFAGAMSASGDLAQVRLRLSAAPDQAKTVPAKADRSDVGIRRKAMIAAAAVAAIGGAIALAVLHWGGASQQGKPLPPEAPPSAMEK